MLDIMGTIARYSGFAKVTTHLDFEKKRTARYPDIFWLPDAPKVRDFCREKCDDIILLLPSIYVTG